MKDAYSAKFSDLAYLVGLSLFIIFLVLAIISLWHNKTVPQRELWLSILFISLGYVSCLYISRGIVAPMRRMISRATREEKGALGFTPSFEQIVEELSLSRKEAKRWNEELEMRVRERTREVMESNKKLVETQERLIQSEKLASLGEMAASLSHEIRNPLGIITTAAGCLRDNPRSSKTSGSDKFRQMEEQIRIIETEATRVSKIADSLLKFSRLSHSLPPRAELESTDVNRTVNEALSAAASFLQGINIVKSFTSSLPGIRIDAHQLLEVFSNIIRNALQAMPRGGTLTIATRLSGKTVEVSFTDTGSGIPADNLAKIFNPFFTTKGFGEGTGLGLAIASSIVARVGGKIKTESQPDKGTTFIVVLPLNNQEESKDA